MDEMAISVPEAARRLGISRTFAYQMIRAGDIPSVKIGQKILVPMKWLEEKLKPAQKTGTAA